MAEEEKRELSSEEIVQIVQNQAAQIDQLNLMVKDLGGKVSQREVENSQLRAALQQIAGQQQKAQADDTQSEEE
jgi:hypothetical protein|tara:strand:- start:2963 stop:3184 length:222 start_codon:yes stop_codon:yes gene_type:complete